MVRRPTSEPDVTETNLWRIMVGLPGLYCLYSMVYDTSFYFMMATNGSYVNVYVRIV